MATASSSIGITTANPSSWRPGLTNSCVPSPVHSNGVVYVMCGYGGSALHAIRLAEAKGDTTASPQAIVWKYDRDTPWVPSPLLYGDQLYFLKSNTGLLSVFKARTGEKLYGPQRLEWQVHIYGNALPEIRSVCAERHLALHEFGWQPAMERAGLQRHALYLLRPDGYVALAASEQSAPTLTAYLQARAIRFS